jgi:hypothetical protein
MLLARHRAVRLTWCRRYLRFRIQDWANILFTDESRFHLDSSDGHSRVYHRVGERYADAYITRGRPERLLSLVLPNCLNRLHNDSILLR